MKRPTAEQKRWAEVGLKYTIEHYQEWTRKGYQDYTPMLCLLEHIRSSSETKLLSIWKSHDTLSVASASHIVERYLRIDGAPCLWIEQSKHDFIFRDACDKKRSCPFADALQLYDVQLIRLRMKVDEFDARKPRATNTVAPSPSDGR